ncbi:MAG: NUDIX domain-containing protein [Chloroflexi bacterium]|nr:NUDIX domain-containing protein [Chloroflexota bacterium]
MARWPYGYCPDCGGSLDIFCQITSTHALCPHCGAHHYRDPKTGAGVLIEDAGRLLLVRRAVDPRRGTWHVPSGFVDYGESPQDAARREVLEETGLQVELDNLFRVLAYTDDERGAGIFILFKAHITGGAPVAADDVDKVGFFSPQELPPTEALAFKNTRLIVAAWRQAQQES